MSEEEFLEEYVNKRYDWQTGHSESAQANEQAVVDIRVQQEGTGDVMTAEINREVAEVVAEYYNEHDTRN